MEPSYITAGQLAQAQMWITLLVGGAAAAEDLARRTISNWTCLAALASGLAVQTLAGGWTGLGMGLLGAVAGFAVFLIFYLLGGMGGGDVKLMSGFGAMLGLWQVPWAAFWTALTGGVVAGAVLGGAALRARWRLRRDPAAPPAAPVAIPYAPAIVAGVALTLLAATP